MIALEWWLDRRHLRLSAQLGCEAKSSYGLRYTLSSLSMGLLSQVAGVFGKFVAVATYGVFFSTLALWPQADIWNHWYGWLLALLLYDLCYYWLHRAGHEVAVFWAAHAAHHQSQHYNLSTALRQTSTGALLGWLFYLPMAALGVPPVLFGIVALVDLLYQFWVHTEHVGRLGWFDRVFCSPSNHRVHHAINDHYLDRNYGGILVLWDRLFGTFTPEREPCIYGTRTPLNSWDPIWANFAVYAQLWQRAVAAPHWSDKLRVWLQPPSWLAPHEAKACVKAPPVDLAGVQTYRPPLDTAQALFAVAQNALLTALGAWYLWNVDARALPIATLGALALSIGLWALGRYLQQQLSWWNTLAVQALTTGAVLATNPLGV
jgi:sterol desaturase/sphingolipid hydroxylase (fatty acid hydroxylase superfamily)